MRYLWLIVFLFVHDPCIAQRADITGDMHIDAACVYTNEFSPEKLSTKYPFNAGSRVFAVAYTYTPLTPPIVDKKGNVKEIKRISAYKDTLGYKDVREIVELSKSAVDSFASILYNYTTKIAEASPPSMSCYSPRNSIIFVDKDGKPVANMDICFECRRSYMHPDEFKRGEVCEGRYRMIYQLLRDAGIKYGITTTE